MATAPSDRGPVRGRVDRAGRLVAADPELAALQMQAGSEIGATLALPQIASVARLARKLGIPVFRTVTAAASDYDLDLAVRAVPQGDEVALSLEGWARRAAAPPRLATLLSREEDSDPEPAEVGEWSADRELRLISLSVPLAEWLGSAVETAVGQPLTRLLRLEENDEGEMPLLAALAARHGFADQPARSRAGDARLILSGEVLFAADGSFDGFSGRAAPSDQPSASVAAAKPRLMIDEALDEALRSPLARIVEAAERIADRGEGPLKSEYAAYATDISAAARHLLSVIEAMRRQPAGEQRNLDLSALAAEAVVLVEAAAEAKQVTITLEASRRLRASGDERPVIQILVNLIGNAVRHSPANGTVNLRFARGEGSACVIVSDQGPGIEPADQQRIFERFERASSDAGGTGLGLAISRRLARSMGGDITLDSSTGQGARFTLTLPAA